MTDMCKRGLHERNAENSRRRTVTRGGGKTSEINECLACARERRARQARPKGLPTLPVTDDATADSGARI